MSDKDYWAETFWTTSESMLIENIKHLKRFPIRSQYSLKQILELNEMKDRYYILSCTGELIMRVRRK